MKITAGKRKIMTTMMKTKKIITSPIPVMKKRRMRKNTVMAAGTAREVIMTAGEVTTRVEEIAAGSPTPGSAVTRRVILPAVRVVRVLQVVAAVPVLLPAGTPIPGPAEGPIPVSAATPRDISPAVRAEAVRPPAAAGPVLLPTAASLVVPAGTLTPLIPAGTVHIPVNSVMPRDILRAGQAVRDTAEDHPAATMGGHPAAADHIRVNTAIRRDISPAALVVLPTAVRVPAAAVPVIARNRMVVAHTAPLTMFNDYSYNNKQVEPYSTLFVCS
jgi:hypothetical protein